MIFNLWASNEYGYLTYTLGGLKTDLSSLGYSFMKEVEIDINDDVAIEIINSEKQGRMSHKKADLERQLAEIEAAERAA